MDKEVLIFELLLDCGKVCFHILENWVQEKTSSLSILGEMYF